MTTEIPERAPADRASRLVAHAPWAILCALALAVTAWVPPHQMPVRTCVWLRATGIPCALCGTTRAFHAAGNGRWAEALEESPFAVLLYAAVWATLLFHTAALLDRRGGSFRPFPGGAVARRWLWFGVGALLLANWAYRLAAGRQ